jgi:serine/threonine protein kinase
MDPAPPPSAAPALLAPGTLLGPWRILALAGKGGHGEVYRAVRADDELARPVALKVARRPGDPRFPREVKLLSLFHHPSVPRLIDQGVWRPAAGAPRPFFVMEWIEGAPLYEWAQRQPPTSPQVLRLLCQLAQALAALHAKGGLHRDIKGDNVMVRREDGRAILTDFGSGLPPGASTLTPPGVFVGTRAYRSPESWGLELRWLCQPQTPYAPTAADDVFALGTTACRLLTGQYPELGKPTPDKSGQWSLETLVLPPALLRVEEPLRALVLSMLAVHPEQRPSSAQLAHALGQATGAQKRAPPAQPPASERVPPPVRRRAPMLPGLALTAASLMLAAGVGWAVSQHPALKAAVARNEAAQAEGSTAGLGDTASSHAGKNTAARSTPQSVAEEPLPEPQPGQLRTNSKGLCPRANQVPLNGACWARPPLDSELCEEARGQMFKGACYIPLTPLGRPPTSSPKSGQGGAQ